MKLTQKQVNYLMKRAAYQSKKLAQSFDLNDDQREDCMQDMIADALKALHKYNPSRASFETFINGVLKICFKRIRTALINARMKQYLMAIPLYQIKAIHIPSVNDASIGELNIAELIDLRIDIENITSEMPPRLKNICHLLMIYRPSEAAKRAGIYRTSIYRNIKEISRYFEDRI